MARTAGKRPPKPAPRTPQAAPASQMPGPSRSTTLAIVAIIVIMAGAGIAAFIIAGNRDEAPPVTLDIEPAQVSGVALPTLEAQPDGAIGRAMPVVQSTDFAGNPQSLEATGSPQAILFLAHWCPHCRDEVPVVQEWLDGGGLPDGVEFRSVATSINSEAPNYPPDAWLEREGWTPPVVVDTAGTVAEAYGLSGFPFWVFVDADGTVVGRTSGGLPVSDLEAILSRF